MHFNYFPKSIIILFIKRENLVVLFCKFHPMHSEICASTIIKDFENYHHQITQTNTLIKFPNGPFWVEPCNKKGIQVKVNIPL